MLDTDTKRRIDTARDILVGKVPDPKSQVEQITIALIYKFMDDMDADSEEMGGKRKFFTGEFARYGWAKLMDRSLGGHEMLGLYGEGISKMPENPGIPPLFRDIFKNAYLPYRDPETLKAFLKIIDEFSYDHSERLGDAFEYLLSVLGSQGDAGQFRTPRHIIDFMVEVIAPQKDETILDPACGTAGFLISAWKYVLAHNTSKPKPSPPPPLPEGEGRHYRGGFEFAGLAQKARELRVKQTNAETLLWELLRDRQLCDAKFRRQHPFGDYICDFYCHEAMLVVECDGTVHETPLQQEHDQKRDAYLKSQGIRELRFQNNRILNDPATVLEEIAAYLSTSTFFTSPAGRGTGEGAPHGSGVGGEGEVAGRPGDLLTPDKKGRLAKNFTGKEDHHPSTSGRGAGGEGEVAGRPGDLLTPDEKGRLAKNFIGYDISPDMVRLSLVNLYLHGFADPHIYEYDTLTSEERWNEYADVILANPPFMSPKGGIKPHKRFSIQAKRSEVLFVDYMAEHLTPSGRAAIIVPEGIIFQSQTAYKALRKMLVENSLVAVVSLPAGCFNPYSGVKTSILILDKAIARQSDTIAFFKVENDGFGLGAQRRAIEKNDLPQVQAELAAYLQALRSGSSPTGKGGGEGDNQLAHGLVVLKDKIAENGDYNLSGERYRESDQRSCEYPHYELGQVVDILDSLRRPITKCDRKPGPHPYYGATGVLDYVEGYLFDEPLVLVGEDGAKWESGEKTAFPVDGKVWVNNHAHVLRPKRDRLIDRFLIEILNEADLMPYVTGVTVPKLNQEKLRSIQIPLPPLEVQKEIVAEIEGYQKVINGARAVLDNYRPHIPIHPDWPLVELGEVCNIKTGKLNSNAAVEDGEYPFFTCSKDVFKIDQYAFDCEAILLSGNNASGDFDVKHYHGKFNAYQRTYIITVKNELLETMTYGILKYILNANLLDLKQKSIGGLTRYLTLPMITSIKLPLPPLATQQAIVAELEAEQALVAANRELITRFEQKIQATLARIWGEDVSVNKV